MSKKELPGEIEKRIARRKSTGGMKLRIRKTAPEDLDTVMRIYERAVRFMAESGNPNQWVNGYPARELIAEDIKKGVSYVMESESAVEAVFSYIEGADETYRKMEQGSWRSGRSYGTVHRLASAGNRGGMSDICFEWCAKQGRKHGCGSLRADTHQDNQIMQHLLEQNGFSYCGVIHLADGAPRLAYERVY